MIPGALLDAPEELSETEPLERGRAEEILAAPADPADNGGGPPPREPPPDPRGPRRGDRPPRPPGWKRVVLWAGILIISWIVGFALGNLVRSIERRWEHQP